MKILNNKIIKYTLWGIFILMPILVGIFSAVLSNTSLLKMDEWFTSINDEVGYYRTVQQIRTNGLVPIGMRCYNEAEALSGVPSWGVYTVFTYLPYVFFSFFTGISSHNFMVYCNILMMVLANVVVVFLLKPNTMRTFTLCVFLLSQFTLSDYIWSGMTECSHVMMSIIVIVITLWLMNEDRINIAAWKVNLALVMQIIIIIFYGLIRPFEFGYIIFPMIYILSSPKKKKNKIILSTVLVLLSVAMFKIYMYVNQFYCSKYFDSQGVLTQQYKSLIANGDFRMILENILNSNKQGISKIMSWIENNKLKGLMMIQLLIVMILLISLFAAKCKKGGVYKKKYMIIGIVLAVVTIYEATVILYTTANIHRMMLAIFIGMSYFLILEADILENAVILLVSVLFLGYFWIFGPLDALVLPQTEESINTEEVQQSLHEAFSFIEGEEGWEVTLARKPRSKNLWLNYCLPNSIAVSPCTNSFICDGIKNDTLKSRFVWATDETEVYAICEEYQYEAIWGGYGYTIFKRW
ncbi:MAG: hypothetical protein HDQ96_00665 [Lachnospiraceae bacterium]|nr:hypothetical protein [Lachnospiraceae bacterium]